LRGIDLLHQLIGSLLGVGIEGDSVRQPSAMRIRVQAKVSVPLGRRQSSPTIVLPGVLRSSGRRLSTLPPM
jgi:hypothetical protein